MSLKGGIGKGSREDKECWRQRKHLGKGLHVDSHRKDGGTQGGPRGSEQVVKNGEAAEHMYVMTYIPALPRALDPILKEMKVH